MVASFLLGLRSLPIIGAATFHRSRNAPHCLLTIGGADGDYRGILQDPVEYPEPHHFKPERYLPKDESKMPRSPEKVIFGYGKRFESLVLLMRS